MNLRALPVFWQMLLLIVMSLVVAQGVTILMFVSAPPPRPDFVTMGELSDTLVPLGTSQKRPSRRLIRTLSPTPPVAGEMVSDPALTQRLARDVGVPVSAVRLFYEADQSVPFFYRYRVKPSTAVPTRHGEPYFFNTVVAARQMGERWLVLRSPPRPWLSDWQRRSLTWFGLSLLLMLPVIWLFTRALTRPIRRFAAAVERLDHDPDAPPIPEEGPAELRLTAHALNAMQQRLHAYLRERAAMIGAIAHDLRTPLARITFRIEAAPDPIRRQVQADVEQMRAMVAATMAFVRSGPGVGERSSVDVGALLLRLGELAREMGGEVDLAAIEPQAVMGDASALERMFQNLIDNALKYAGTVELSMRREGRRVVVEVADRGPGVPPDKLERMFEPFERGDPSRSRTTGGLGLGLAIARGIATAHRGAMRAENRAGGGLKVTVELPAA